MEIKIYKAAKKRLKVRIGLSGPSGSGKSYSALLLARGLCDDWAKICVIDSENGRADLYAGLGEYMIIPLSAPYTPERYLAALDVAIKAGMEVIIVDSISHAWSGRGGISEDANAAEAAGKNSFQSWAQPKTRHKKFIETLISAPVHTILTMRCKTDYVMEVNAKGKMQPVKVGLKDDTAEGVDYEMMIYMRLNQSHVASIEKDNTGLFGTPSEILIDANIGAQIRDWCNSESPAQFISAPAPAAPPAMVTAQPIALSAALIEELSHLSLQLPADLEQKAYALLRRANSDEQLTQAIVWVKKQLANFQTAQTSYDPLSDESKAYYDYKELASKIERSNKIPAAEKNKIFEQCAILPNAIAQANYLRQWA